MFNINPTVKLVIGLILVAVVGAMNAVYVVEPMWKWLGSFAGVLGFLETFFTVPTAAAAKLKALAAKSATQMLRLLSVLFVLAVGLLLSGCLSSAPIVPVTPANQAQVTSCENTATLHNDVVIGDFAFTGFAGAAGAVGAIDSDMSVKTAMGVTAGIAGAGAIVMSSIAALSSNNFANNQCSSVVGNLPASSPAGAK